MGRPRKNPITPLESPKTTVDEFGNEVPAPSIPSAEASKALTENPKNEILNNSIPDSLAAFSGDENMEHKQILDIAKQVMATSLTPETQVPVIPIANHEEPLIRHVFTRITTSNSKDYGLIEGVNYQYKPDGRIDWEAMFDPEYYIYPHNDPSKTALLKVDGLRELAEIRGVESKKIEFQQTTPDMVICKVTVKYIPNFEDPNGREWSAIADASTNNIGTQFAKYLATMAETRATGRCHREALGIRLCTWEEVDPKDVGEPEDTKSMVNDVTMAGLHRQMELKGVSKEELLKKIQEKYPDMTSFDQLKQFQAAKLLNYLSEKQNIKN